jgi:heterogeneous nuclear rnp K-like protein 2
MSASQIKIMEPGATSTGVNGGPAPTGGEGERLVVITGPPANIQMAVQLLYHVRFTSLIVSLRSSHPPHSAWSKRSRSKSEQDQMYE